MKVIQYNEDNLAESLSNIYTSVVNIKKKKQFGYLKNYLESKDINAQTIVIEDEYTK